MDSRTMAEKYKSELMRLYGRSTSANISNNSGVSGTDGNAGNIQENNPEPAEETENIQENIPETVPVNITEDISEDIPEDIPENNTEKITERITEKILEDITENNAESGDIQPDTENFHGISDHDSSYFPYTGDEGGEYDAGSMERTEEHTVAEYPTQRSMGDSTGYIIVNVRAGHDAYPIEGAAVVVSAAVDGQRIIIASGETDISGTTIRFSVPAPNERYSQIPDSAIRPYNLFDITVTARGYNDSRNTDVY
ncbi:MAG: hypothetical protein K2J37_06955, partial [Ruminococcus sp.]|nr:hypothetical protein [Ruminococcus sp.]